MFNPAEASENIKNEFIDYILTSFSIADNEYNSLFKEKLYKNGIISRGPLIDVSDTFKSGQTLRQLCANGVLSKLFLDLEAAKPNDEKHKKKLPLDRPLYLHQVNAIDVITTKQLNAVITTGTGSGKTECFLLPVINELLKEKENGTLNAGVRAILVYPMNALANDQMKRLRELLMYYPDITFGVYNGDTEHKEDKAYAQYMDLHSGEACEELRKPLKNEFIYREQMNETPPHILCTNYAMLERMMLKPENDKIFANSDFKFVVLDEAHIYAGATGMETALLLRRLKARITTSTKTQFILTSATLGEKGKSEDEIISFAENLCGEEFLRDGIVFGQKEIPNFTNPANNVPIQLFEELAVAETEEQFQSIFEEYELQYNNKFDYAWNFYNLCRDCSYYRILRSSVSQPTDIKIFAELLNITEKQAVALIHICSRAVQNGKSLIDVKYHFFIRALEGVYSSLIGEKDLFLERRKVKYIEEDAIAVFERAVCANCGELGLVGKIEAEGKIEKLVLASQYDDKIKYFHIDGQDEAGFEEIEDEGIDEPTTDDEDSLSSKAKIKALKKYYLCPKCGAISRKEDGMPRCKCGFSPIAVSEYANADGKCPKCQMGKYRRFYIGAEAATGVLATALYEELPVKKITEEQDDGRTVEFDGGKQFLAFSDSRSEAAFFASYLDKSYKEFLRRRGLVRVLNDNREDILDEPMPLDRLMKKLSRLFVKFGSFKENLTAQPRKRELEEIAEKNAWVAILTELVYARRRNSLVALGQVKFEYCGNTDVIVNALSKKYALDVKACKELLDWLAMSFAYFGALKVDEGVIDADSRKYIFYTDMQKAVMLQKPTNSSRYTMGWKARNREGKANSFYPNSRVRLVARVLHSDEIKANEFLEDYFNQWLVNKKNEYCLERCNGNFYFMPTENYQIRLFGDDKARWYKCKKCGKVTCYNIDSKCVENGCSGDLEEFDPTKVIDSNHYLKLYNKQDYTALLIREHTAQLSRETGLQYQTDFEKNRIHALSCSTTFEMGVDVGELETVFLRNVPPTASNYAQRAGRAGRSKNSAAYALTYAKLSSHDFTYFSEPQKIIVGRIKPPVFKTDNEKIVLRHIYAVVLSYFFGKHSAYFGNNRATEFLDKGGYEKFVEVIEKYPKELDDILIASIPNIDNYNWKKRLIGVDGILSSAVSEYNKELADMQNVIQAAMDKMSSNRDDVTIKECSKQISREQYLMDKFRAGELIDFFVRNNILPKYGFPIDTADLDVFTDDLQKQDLKLSRDLKMAISEYAPGEKVIANNKMYTSRYIKKSFFNNRMDYYNSFVYRCDCGTWNLSKRDPRGGEKQLSCIACHKPISNHSWMEAIEPRAGFVAEKKVEEVPLSRPEKIYHSEDSYIGDGKKINEYVYYVNGRKIILKSSENDEIMVTSNTKFYVCRNCGYTYGIHDIIKDENGKRDKLAEEARSKQVQYITVKRLHKDYREHFCNNTVFYPYRLNHIYKTDVVLLDFGEYNANTETMLSVLYSLLNAMSEVLGIDINDIGGCLKGVFSLHNRGLNFSLVLHDTVAGGAGHVRRLLNPSVFKLVVEKAYNRVTNCSCDTSCYNCLRSYSNQRIHEKLDRHLASKFLEGFLGEVEEINETTEERQQTKSKISILSDGLDVEGETYEYIFSLLDIETDLKDKLVDSFYAESVDKPNGNDVDFAVNGEKGYADLAWIDKKVLLFTENNQSSYELASKTDFVCFILTKDLKVEDLIKALN